MASQTEKMMQKLAKESQVQDKKQEVEYIKGEKRADEFAMDKLTKLYGGGAKQTDSTRRRTKGWKCPECKFVNYDIRAVCGNCLCPNPEVTQVKRKNIKLPGKSADPFSTIVATNGRCYRSFATSSSNFGTTSSSAAEIAVPTYRDDYDEDDDPEMEDCDDESGDGIGVIVRDPQDKEGYLMKLRVPARYWKFLIGSKGATLQETQRLTGATVVIPKESNAGDDSDIIIVKAQDPSSIRSAHLRINSTVLSCKDKVEYTHFISIPLGTIPSLSKSLKSTLDEMSKLTEDVEKKVEPSIFQDPERLHLTLLMLRLHTNDELSKAITLMTSLQREVSELFRVGDRVTLRGLNYMNDDPTEVHVAYLEIEQDDTRAKLIRLINTINQAFIDAGLALEKDVAHNEKLHATVINSKWRRSTVDGGPREPFNATDIFKKFGRVDLGSHRLESIELSILGGGNALYGYFPSEATIEFPKN